MILIQYRPQDSRVQNTAPVKHCVCGQTGPMPSPFCCLSKMISTMNPTKLTIVLNDSCKLDTAISDVLVHRSSQIRFSTLCSLLYKINRKNFLTPQMNSLYLCLLENSNMNWSIFYEYIFAIDTWLTDQRFAPGILAGHMTPFGGSIHHLY